MKRILAVLVAGAAAWSGGCSVNPETGESVLTLMSWDEERSLGAEAAPQFTEEFGGRVDDAPLQAYVSEIGRGLAATTTKPDLEWEFTLLKSDVINAFALPGGKVFVTRGLASKMANEAQLAGVIGHEIGHVTARHGNQRISQQILFNAGLAVTAVIVEAGDNDKVKEVAEYGIPALAIGGNLVLLSYGRDEELEADRLGVRYMARLNYNPYGQLQVMELLAREAGGPRQPEFLSTHPHSQSRIAHINDMLAGEFAYTQNNPQYQLFDERFRTRFLSRLGAAPTGDAGLALASPSGWCAHCAAGH